MASGITFPPRHLWPIGFGFRPTEEELITYYLKNKMLANESLVQYVCEVDLYNYEPWQLPNLSIFESDNHEWFFFRAQPSHGRHPKTKRTTRTGYWKSTGEDRKIKARGTNKVIGTRKILVFHEGKSPNGVKTRWIIHEYHLHLDDNIAYQRSFVICRLKENAEEKDVSTYDDNEQNDCVASHLKKKVTERAIQPVYSKSQEFQFANGYDGELNRQLMQPRATESEINLTELLNLVHFEDECFDDVTSKMNVDSYNEPDQSPWYSESEPASMNFQPANSYDGEVHRQSIQPGSSVDGVDLTELLSSVFVEDAKFDELTSTICIDNYNKEELDSMVFELQYGGFSSDTDNDAAFCWPNNNISPGWFHGHTSLGEQTQNMSTIKESRRSPLTVKRLQYKEENDIYHFDESRGNSSFLSSEGEARNCSISMNIDDSDHGPRTFKGQCQPISKDLVPYGSVPRRIRLQREIRSKAISQYKAKEGEKHIKVVSPPQISITDSSHRQKSVAGNNTSKCSMSYESTDSKGSGFSYILTTKHIHHKSSLPLVYVAKAFLGIILFRMFVQEVLVYGSWC